MNTSDEHMKICNQIMAHISEGVSLIRASDHVIVYTNPKFDEMFGYAAGELIGKHISYFNAPSGISREKSEEAIFAYLSKRGVWQGEMINIKKNGTPCLNNARISAFHHPLYEKVLLAVYTDITEYKNKQKKMIEQIDYLQRNVSVEVIPNPIYYKDREGKYTNCNRAFEEFIGLARDKILGKTTYEVGPNKIANIVFEKDNELFQNPGTQTHEWKVTDKKGNLKECIVHKSTFNDLQGNVVGLVGIISDVTSLKESERHYRIAATTDELTGLLNRRGFLALAQKQCYIASRNDLNLYLLFVDLDGLKKINDQHGHNAGDEALINTAHILLESFRASDIIARIGGDEFVVISVETPEINKNMLTRRLKESLANYNSKSNKPYKLCFSMGLTRYRGEGSCSVDALLARADAMMYKDKKDKKGLS